MGGVVRRALLPVRVLAVALAVSLMLCCPGCREKGRGARVKVAASIVPLADFCRNVGGSLVDVKVMVPPGASPHAFEPTVEQMRFLSEADVFVTNGLHLETWATDVLRKVGNPETVKVAAGKAVPEKRLLPPAGVDKEKGDAEPVDPHVWLAPDLAAYQVKVIRDGLVKADPAQSGIYTKNADNYLKELEALDGEIKERTSRFGRRKFIALHPAWTYFANRYGLDQVGVIEELPGKEPSARQIAELVEEMKHLDVKVVFAEPQFSPKAAEVIVKEAGTGGVLKILDPLGNPDDPGVSTYIKLMRHDVGVMEEAMQ